MVGCIAMFDVLGWKEMQARKENALEEYLAFVVLLKRWLLSFIHDGQGFVARVDLNIVSDTLFLYAPCEHRNMYRCLNHFATIASKIISDGIQHGFFMRGAISFGQFQLNLGSAVFIGDALDDVAAQYENANWIGCHLSPNLSHVGMGPYGLRNSWVQYNGCPLKIAPLAENNFICISDGVPEEERVPITNHIFVVDFMQGMQDEQKQQIKNALSKEQQSHSDCQRVAEKYENTLKFIHHFSESKERL